MSKHTIKGKTLQINEIGSLEEEVISQKNLNRYGAEFPLDHDLDLVYKKYLDNRIAELSSFLTDFIPKIEGFLYESGEQVFELSFTPVSQLVVSASGWGLDTASGLAHSVTGNVLTILSDIPDNTYIQVFYFTGPIEAGAISSVESQSITANMLALQRDVEGGNAANDTAILNLNTVSQLSSVQRRGRTRAFVNGGSQGGSMFTYVASGLTADGGVVFAAEGGGFWRRDFQGQVFSSWFGAVGDGVANDYPAATAALSYLSASGGGVWAVNGDLNLGGSTLAVPANVLINTKFGRFFNGTITGNKTRIEPDRKNIFGSSVTVGGTWNVDAAFPEWFGAVGDNTTDDSGAFNKAYAFCRSSGCKKILLGADKTYVIKEPVNASGNAIRLASDRKGGNSRILLDLTDTTHAFEMTDAKRSKWENITLRSKVTSNHTIAIVLAETEETGANLIEFNGCYLASNDSPNCIHVVYAITCDQLKLMNTEIVGVGASMIGAVYLDSSISYGLTSEFGYSITAFGSDLTKFETVSSQAIGEGQYVLRANGYTNISMFSPYFSRINGGVTLGAIYIDSSAGGQRVTQLIMDGGRIENSSDNIENNAVFYLTGTSNNWNVSGYFNQKAVFEGPGNLINSELNISFSGTLLSTNFTGFFSNVKFNGFAGVGALGTASTNTKNNSNNLTFTGRVGSYNDIINAFGTTRNLTVKLPTLSTNVTESNYASLINFGRTTDVTNAKKTWKMPAFFQSIAEGVVSAESLVSSRSISSTMLVSRSGYPLPDVHIKLSGLYDTGVTTCQLRVSIKQGSTEIFISDLITQTATTNSFEFDINLVNIQGSTNDLRAFVKSRLYKSDGDVTLSKVTNIPAASGISPNATEDIVVNLYATSDVVKNVFRLVSNING